MKFQTWRNDSFLDEGRGEGNKATVYHSFVYHSSLYLSLTYMLKFILYSILYSIHDLSPPLPFNLPSNSRAKSQVDFRSISFRSQFSRSPSSFVLIFFFFFLIERTFSRQFVEAVSCIITSTGD